MLSGPGLNEIFANLNARDPTARELYSQVIESDAAGDNNDNNNCPISSPDTDTWDTFHYYTRERGCHGQICGVCSPCSWCHGIIQKI